VIFFSCAIEGAERSKNPTAASAIESATLTLDLTSFSLRIAGFVNRLDKRLAHGREPI
jgi:hypothetical protein